MGKKKTTVVPIAKEIPVADGPPWLAIENALDKTWIVVRGQPIELKDATGEEFLLWVKHVLPLPDGSAPLKPEHFEDYDQRLLAWETVVRVHMSKFMFSEEKTKDETPSA